MKVTECIYEFEKLVEIISPGFKAKQGLDTDTILLALNIAQERFIYNNYLNKPTLSENIVTIHNKQDDLRNLIVQGELLTPVAITVGSLAGIGFRIDIPTYYLYYLRSDTLVSRTAPSTITDTWAANLLIEDYSEINKILTVSYNKPILRQPVVNLKGVGLINLITDSYTTVTLTSGFSLDYLRKPKYLALDDTDDTDTTNTEYELAGYLHEELVKFAVDIFLKEYKFLLIQKEK